MPTPSSKRRHGCASSSLRIFPLLLLALLLLVQVCPAQAQEDAALIQLATEEAVGQETMREEEGSETIPTTTTSAEEVCFATCPSCLSLFSA